MVPPVPKENGYLSLSLSCLFVYKTLFSALLLPSVGGGKNCHYLLLDDDPVGSANIYTHTHTHEQCIYISKLESAALYTRAVTRPEGKLVTSCWEKKN